MKKLSVFALAFAFVGLVGCADEDTTIIEDTDPAVVVPTDPMMDADPMGTNPMDDGTMMTDTMGTGTGMMADSAMAPGAGM